MEDRPIAAYRPDVRRGRAPDAGESPRRPPPYGRPGRAVVMEDYRVEEFSVVVLDPDSPHVSGRGAPDRGEMNGRGCPTRHARPRSAVVTDDRPPGIAVPANSPNVRCRGAPDAAEEGRRDCPTRDPRPRRAVIMEEDGRAIIALLANSPNVRCRGSPNAAEEGRVGCRNRDVRPARAVVMEDHSVVMGDRCSDGGVPDRPHVRRRGTPDAGEVDRWECRRARRVRPGGAVVMEDRERRAIVGPIADSPHVGRGGAPDAVEGRD